MADISSSTCTSVLLIHIQFLHFHHLMFSKARERELPQSWWRTIGGIVKFARICIEVRGYDIFSRKWTSTDERSHPLPSTNSANRVSYVVDISGNIKIAHIHIEVHTSNAHVFSWTCPFTQPSLSSGFSTIQPPCMLPAILKLVSLVLLYIVPDQNVGLHQARVYSNDFFQPLC